MKRLLLIGLLPLSCNTNRECFTDTGTTGLPLRTGLFEDIEEFSYSANIHSIDITDTTLTIRLTGPDDRIYRLVYTIHPTPHPQQ